MTIAEAISRTDAAKPNRFSQRQKIEWLSYLEGQIYKEIILTHEGSEEIIYEPITSDTDTQRSLIAPHPYDEVYILYLQSKIDLGNQEIAKYQNSKAMFNNAYAILRDYWKRTHMPLQSVTHFRV